MPHADTANFNRFLTSLGMLLIAVALVCPYFYFHNSDPLLISAKQLQALTRSERETILGRQQTIAWLETPILASSLVLLTGGIVCLFLGGRRLRAMQTKEDEAMDRQAQRERAAIEDQTDDERNKRLDNQAREAAKSQDASKGLDFLQSRRVVGRTEKRLDESLQGEDFGPYEFLADVKIVSNRSEHQIAIDGLFSANLSGVPDVLLQRRLVLFNPEHRITRYGDTMLALLARYRQLTGRDVQGWLVIILSHQAKSLSSMAREGLRAEFDRALAGLGHVTVLDEEQLDEAPARFRELFIK
jgi:hypothetical protein